MPSVGVEVWERQADWVAPSVVNIQPVSAESLRAFQTYEKYVYTYDLGGKWQNWSRERDAGFWALDFGLLQWHC